MHYTDTDSNIDRKQCTNKKFKSKEIRNTITYSNRKIILRSQSSQQADVKGCFV